MGLVTDFLGPSGVAFAAIDGAVHVLGFDGEHAKGTDDDVVDLRRSIATGKSDGVITNVVIARKGAVKKQTEPAFARFARGIDIKGRGSPSRECINDNMA